MGIIVNFTNRTSRDHSERKKSAEFRSWRVSIIRKAVSRRETFREVPESGIEPTVPAKGASIGIGSGKPDSMSFRVPA
jgi:hypothetical protein